MRTDDVVKLTDALTDNIVAAVIVAVGCYAYLKGDVSNGIALITFGAGYVFGKSNPNKRVPRDGGL